MEVVKEGKFFFWMFLSHSRKTEINHLSNALQANGCTKKQLNMYLYPKIPHEEKKKEETSTSKAILPYILRVKERIGSLLTMLQMKKIMKSHFKTHKFLPKQHTTVLDFISIL